MAGDWIKWEKGLARKPKVLKLAGFWQVSRRDAAVICMEVWEWADEATVDGVVEAPLEAIVDTFAALTGRHDILEGLESVDWLIRTSCGVVFPKFARHNGETAKFRAQNAKRQGTWRTRSETSE